jgi:hypothetical protein
MPSVSRETQANALQVPQFPQEIGWESAIHLLINRGPVCAARDLHATVLRPRFARTAVELTRTPRDTSC